MIEEGINIAESIQEFIASFFGGDTWFVIAAIIGELVVILFIIWLLIAVISGIIIALSIKKRRKFLPKIWRSIYTICEAVVKVVCQMFGVDEDQILAFLINIDNEMNKSEFAKTPVEMRAVFFPHCLRSKDCPANLTPSGITCRRCGRCRLGDVIPELNKAGYVNVFIIPGSTFIKRLIKKYKIKAMIGIGCLNEVKDGLELGRKIHMTTIGVVNLTDGCIETRMNVDAVLEAASLGLEKPITIDENNLKGD